MTSEKLNRRSAVVRILRDRGDALVVTGLGNPSYDVMAAGDTPANFYLWGAMGGAAMVGLGVALAQPGKRVLVITGDGEMLMGLGALATIAVERPANLSICVLDNEFYAETGMQTTHTGRGVDLTGIARAAGFPEAMTVRTTQELEVLAPKLYAARSPVFGVVKISTEPNPSSLPPRDGPHLRGRFRAALMGAEAHR
jgi:thiamine pyrophosphate-dependent acetolactate synthase large subunit-like protein